MKVVNDNLKKAGYLNAVLIVIAIVLRLVSIGSVPTVVQIDSALCIIALIFGLFYSLSGYKKDSAKYYRAFMYLYLVSSIVSLLAPLLVTSNTFITVINAIIVILVLVLAFAKDIGVDNSTYFSLLILLLNLVKLFYSFTGVAEFSKMASNFANLILACILCIFVSAKYKDKESRGSK